MADINIKTAMLTECANIPKEILDLHRVFVRIRSDNISFEFRFIKKTDPPINGDDWYEYLGKLKLISCKKEPSKELSKELKVKDPILYTNITAFLEECCEISSDYTISHPLLYKRYTLWCQTHKCASLDIRTFIKYLKSCDYMLINLRVWNGIRLIQ